MQSAYIGKIMDLAQKDSNVLHILADSGTGYDEMFKRNFPDQIYNFGISEESMVAAAAGMATVGKIPFVYTAGAFLVYRALEFIRDDICFQNLNVKIVGMGSGLAWSSLGPTHHTTEDIAILRAIPNLMILSPATPKQVAEAVELAYKHKGPVYIRIGMNKETEFFADDYQMEEGKTDIIANGLDGVIYTTGSILEEVVKAGELLAKEGRNIKIVNVSCIKPFDKTTLIQDAKQFHNIFVVEEHNIYGGLASVVAETIAYNGLGTKVIPIGLSDVFAKGYGTHAKVRQCNGLDAYSIFETIRNIRNEGI